MGPMTARILIIGACAALFGAAMIAGCGSSGSATGSTASGVAISGTVSAPTATSASESAPLRKSEGLKAATYATDAAVGAGKTVTCTDAKTGAVHGTAKTDSSGDYSITIPTDATDVLITADLGDGTTLSRLYTAAGTAATDAAITPDTTTAGVVVMQKCKDLVGEDVTVANFASKCGAPITAGTLIPKAIFGPFLDMITTNITGTPSATTGSGTAAGMGLAFREMLSRKLGGDANLRSINPAEVLRGAYVNGDSTALGQFTSYAPATAAAVDMSTMFGFAKNSLGPALAATVNDATTYGKFGADPAAVARFFDSMDSTNAAKIIAKPADMQFQIRDCFDNSKKALLKDPKYFQVFTAAVGDSTFAAQTSDDAKKAYMGMIYNADLSGKTSGFGDIGKGFIAALGATCPAGTCNSGKLLTLQSCPTCLAGTIVNDPTQFAGASGTTVAGNLFSQFGNITSAAGAPTVIPTLKACSASSDCGSGFACFASFCQPTTAAAGSTTATKDIGASCSFSYECKSFMCAPTGTGSTTQVCQTNTAAPTIASGGGCTSTSQCAPPLTCDSDTHTCKSAPTLPGGAFGGKYQKASGAANTVLDSTLFISFGGGGQQSTTFIVDLSGGVFGHLTNGALASGKFSFSGTVTTSSGASVTLTCSDVGTTVVSNVTTALSGVGKCTLGGVSKDINHTLSTGS